MSKLKMLDFSNDSGLVSRAAVRYEFETINPLSIRLPRDFAVSSIIAPSHTPIPRPHYATFSITLKCDTRIADSWAAHLRLHY